MTTTNAQEYAARVTEAADLAGKILRGTLLPAHQITARDVMALALWLHTQDPHTAVATLGRPQSSDTRA